MQEWEDLLRHDFLLDNKSEPAASSLGLRFVDGMTIFFKSLTSRLRTK